LASDAKPLAAHFCVHGYRFTLHTSRADAREAILRLYGRFQTQGAQENAVQAALSEDGDGFAWVVGEVSGTAPDIGSSLWSLESALCEATIRSQRRMIAVHAAAIYSGRLAALLVGSSGAGKSTLSFSMIRRAFTIATDDVSLVDPDTLAVFPIPRCFHLDDTSVSLLKADGTRLPEVWSRSGFMTPADLNREAVPRVRAAILVFISGPREERPRIAAISQSEMAARLLSETGKGPLTDLETVAVLSRIASGASCLRLVPGPLTQTADLLADAIRTGREDAGTR